MMGITFPKKDDIVIHMNTTRGIPHRTPKQAFYIALLVFLFLMIGPLAIIKIYYQTNFFLTSQALTERQTVATLTASAVKLKVDHLTHIAATMASSTDL